MSGTRLSAVVDTTPTYYNLRYGSSGMGSMDKGDICRALINLTLALMAIGSMLDTDAGTIGTDYASGVGTDLLTAHAKLMIPTIGPVT